MSNDKNDCGTFALRALLFTMTVELLRVAKCPNCDGCGFTVHEMGGCGMDGENDTREIVQEQCQWCFNRNGLLEEYDALNKPHSDSK